MILFQMLTGELPVDFEAAQDNIVEIFRLKKSPHLDIADLHGSLPEEVSRR